MKRKSILSKSVLLILLVPFLFPDDNRRERILCQVIQEGLAAWHFRPQPLDDELSKKSFILFRKNLDSTKSFLLESDMRRLQAFSTRIDDEIESGAMDLASLGGRLLHERIGQVQEYCREILRQPFDFSQKEWIDLDADRRSNARTPKELKEWWRKQLKYFALTRYVNAEKAEAKLPSATGNDRARTPAKLEEKVRKEVAGSMEGYFRRLLRERPEETRARLLNAVIATFDPHSRYFPPRDKEDFDIEMSGTLEGIGVLLGEEDGFVKVLDVVPGSPAWIQNQIKIEDVLLKVGQADEEPVDVLGMPVSDVARLVRGRKGTQVRLTVRKPDGRIMELVLVRNIIELQETYARSAILVNEQLPVRVGYIYLPKFYRDFNRENGRSSADDVRRELDSLKRQAVNGVILDLRGNSGGALDDSLRMAGLFIEKGPVVQMKDRRAVPQVYRDDDPEIAYEGPLVILVNSISASASEILAACLQDYGRAVIVGGSHTFGKGTVQMMVDLDQILRDEGVDLRPLGAMTLTVQKYYRVSGASVQFRGIIPDVVVPEPSSYLEIGEKYLDNALPWDSASPVVFNRWNRPALDLVPIVRSSQERLQKNVHFQKLVEYYEWLKERRSRVRLNLNLEDFRSEQEMLWKRADDLAKMEKAALGYKVLDREGKPAGDASADLPAEQQKRISWLKDLEHDEVLDEAVRIVRDIAGQQKK